MKKFNGSGVAFDTEDLKAQMETYVQVMRTGKDKKFSIAKAMDKIGMSKASYFYMLERGTMRLSSVKKFSKLKIGENPISIKLI